MRVALAVLVGTHLAAAAAAFLAPYAPTRQHRDAPLSAPARWSLRDDGGRLDLRPRVSGPDGLRRPLRLLIACHDCRVAGLWPLPRRLFGVDEPGRVFVLGTDSLGRDVFSRLLHGAGVSLGAGLVATLLALSVGVTLGGVAGHCGGLTETLVMRAVDLCESLPWLYLLLALRAFLPLDVAPVAAFLLVAALVGLAGWSRPARLVRGLLLHARGQEFVLAARGLGLSEPRLLARHVLPQALHVVLVQATLLAPGYVLAELTLSFLGLGLGEPTPSWGNMLGAVTQYAVLTHAWWMAAPGVAVLLVVWAYLRVGAALEARWRVTRV